MVGQQSVYQDSRCHAPSVCWLFLNTCGCSAPCRLPSARPRGVLPLLQETQRDYCHPSEQEDLRLQTLHRCRFRPLWPLLLGWQHTRWHHYTPFPAHQREHGRSSSRPLQGWGLPVQSVLYLSSQFWSVSCPLQSCDIAVSRLISVTVRHIQALRGEHDFILMVSVRRILKKEQIPQSLWLKDI